MTIEEIKQILINYYGDIERGCYVNGKWLSVEEIIKLLEKNM